MAESAPTKKLPKSERSAHLRGVVPLSIVLIVLTVSVGMWIASCKMSLAVHLACEPPLSCLIRFSFRDVQEILVVFGQIFRMILLLGGSMYPCAHLALQRVPACRSDLQQGAGARFLPSDAALSGSFFLLVQRFLDLHGGCAAPVQPIDFQICIFCLQFR